LLIETWWGS